MNKFEKNQKKIQENQKRINNKVNAIVFPSFIDTNQNDGYIKLKNINKIYDNNMQAVFDFNLIIKKNEFIVFVGPSGCGKSTTLRMICGLEDITSGSLFIDGKYANELHPKDRDLAMVFQSYALYPHMSVYDNIAFSLKIRKIPVAVFDKKTNKPILAIDKLKIREIINRLKELNVILKEDAIALKYLEKNKLDYSESNYKELYSYYQEKNKLVNDEILKKTKELENAKTTLVPKVTYKHMSKEEINKKVLEASHILQIEPFLYRKPKALSGGQRQRVALGRSIVRNAKVFLMDEPLSNLDAKLRVAMRSEIVALHKKINATTIYVTHDQTEAMTMADRIVVMKDGVVQQIGSPKQIYSHPENLFVATFIGSPAMNILKAKYTKKGIVLDKDVIIDINKSIDVNLFYEKEINRLKLLKENLKISLKEKDSQNTIIYEKAIEKVDELSVLFKDKINKSFEFNFGIRPEHIVVVNDNEKYDAIIKAEIVEQLGSECYVHGHIGESSIVVRTAIGQTYESGDEIKIKFDIDKTHYFDIDTNQSIGSSK